MFKLKSGKCCKEKTVERANLFQEKKLNSSSGLMVLVGAPNVGKSLIFNRLSDTYVTVSNYPGTTVGLDEGKVQIGDTDYRIIDTPGMYSFFHITEEERITKKILFEQKPDVVLNIIDAKNLERMLPLTLQLIEAGFPVIVVLNMIDEAEESGSKIDFASLEVELGVPVVATVATTGKGIAKLNKRIKEYVPSEEKHFKYDDRIEAAVKKIESNLEGRYPFSKRFIAFLLLQEDEDIKRVVENREKTDVVEIINSLREKYPDPVNYVVRLNLQKRVDKIVSSVTSNISKVRLSSKEKLSRLMIRPITGIPILLFILYFGLYLFVGVFGAGILVDFIESRIFGELINPIVTSFTKNIIPFNSVRNLFVGEYGIITMGLTYAVAIILPIVATFFLVFSLVEDSGYLPRLALLVDRMFKKIGLTGRAVIPMVLGLGCDTMATMVTRTQETKRERIISTLLLALAIPCSAQLGVIFAILSGRSGALLIWFTVIILNFFLIGFLSSKILPGEKANFYMELPPLRIPRFSNVLTKTISRIVWYLREVLPLFLFASVIIWVFQLLGIFQLIIKGLEPVVNLLGLPVETAKAFLFGFFRRDYGIAGLYDLKESLTGRQLTVAAVTLTLFVPCIAQFMMMIKERGFKIAMSMFLFVIFFAFTIGFILNAVLFSMGVEL